MYLDLLVILSVFHSERGKTNIFDETEIRIFLEKLTNRRFCDQDFFIFKLEEDWDKTKNHVPFDANT